MNLNTALMSHLQNAPVALKISFIALTVHPHFVVIIRLDFLQWLQLPCSCERFPASSDELR